MKYQPESSFGVQTERKFLKIGFQETPFKMPSRSFNEECEYIERISDCAFLIKKGFVPNMKVGRLVGCMADVNLFLLVKYHPSGYV